MNGRNRSVSDGATAGEFLQQLQSDPAWLLEQKRREEAQAEVAESRRRDEAPVVADLAAVGFQVSSLWMIGSSAVGKTDLLAVLLDHLSRSTYSDFTREAIARSIGRTRIKSAWPELARRYRENPGPREAEGLAVALVECAATDLLEDLLALVQDRTLGPSRILMVRSATRRLRERGDDVLRELALDEELAKEARAVLHERELARARRACQEHRSGT